MEQQVQPGLLVLQVRLELPELLVLLESLEQRVRLETLVLLVQPELQVQQVRQGL